ELRRMLRDDEMQQRIRPWAAFLAALCLFNIVWILKGSQSMRALLAGGILGVVLVPASSALFVCGYNVPIVVGVSAALALSIWLLASAAVVLAGGLPHIRARSVKALAVSTPALVPFLLWQVLTMAVFALRGSVPIYWVMVSALDRGWARWTLVV